jgi:hypothetical protein
MKSQRLLLLVLPVLIVVLVWMVPFSMLRSSASKKSEEANQAEQQVRGLNARLVAARGAESREAELTEQLKAIRLAIPEKPELQQVIRSVADLSTKYKLAVSVLSQDNPMPTVDKDGKLQNPQNATAPATAGSGSVTLPPQFQIKLEAIGKVKDVLAFINEFPNTQRLFLDNVGLTPAGGSEAFGSNGDVKAQMTLKVYYVGAPVTTGS